MLNVNALEQLEHRKKKYHKRDKWLAHRKVTVRGRSIRGSRRYCVKVQLGDGDKKARARKAGAGAWLAPVRFYGCFKSKGAAEKRAATLRRASHLGRR